MSIKELTGALRAADKNGNKQVLYPMTKIDLVDGLRDYLESLEVSKTVFGSLLAVDDSANLPFIGLNVYGKSTQKRTTGAQLVNLPNIEAYDAKGITWSCENGVVTAKGTSTAISSSSDKIVADIPVIAGTYYVSGGVSEVKVYVRIVQADGSYVWYTDQVFTLDGTEDQVALYCQVVAGMTVDATLYPMLNAGDAPLTWEPYTGGKPSPNPDYPQAIANIGDAGSIDVSILGKNLLKFTPQTVTSNGITFTINEDGSVTASGTASTDADAMIYIAAKASPIVLTPGEYALNGIEKDPMDSKIRLLAYTTDWVRLGVNTTTENYFAIDDTVDAMIYLWVERGTTVDATYEPMLRAASIKDNTYETYKAPQTISISTPNGLPGIKVTDASLANYTDSDGTMWCCDEVDFEHGVYVKRIERCTLTAENFLDEFGSSESGVTIQGEIPTKHMGNNYADVVICDCFPTSSWSGGNWNRYDNTICLGGNDENRVQLSLSSNIATSLTAFQEMLGEKMVTVQYVMATPIETPLSDEELAQYAAIHTNCPNTTVSNDKNADMSMTYYSERYDKAVDFIMSKIEDNQADIQAIKDVIEVTLLASNWSGSAAPYTQTVDVPGITEDDNPLLVSALYDGASLDAQKAYSKAFGIVSSGVAVVDNGSVTFKVYKLPVVDITVGLKGV